MTTTPNTSVEVQQDVSVMLTKYAAVPDELRERDQWVLWKYETRGDKKTKVPIQIDGRHASSTDPSTWTSFENCVTHAALADGIGFVFTKDTGIVGIDFDGVRDRESGRIEPWADLPVNDFNSYTEISPSGRGLHVFVRGTLDPNGPNKCGRVELYDRDRFFTVTGVPESPFGSTRVREFDAKALQSRLPYLDPEARTPQAHTSVAARENDPSRKDYEIIGRLRRKYPEATSAEIEKLFEEQFPEQYESQNAKHGPRKNQTYIGYSIQRQIKADERKSQEQAKEFHRVDTAATQNERHVILLQPGRTPEVLAEMESVLVPRAAEFELFQRMTEIVRVVKIQQGVASNGLRRDAGTIMLTPMTRESLAKTLETLIEWRKMGKNGPREVDCPDRLCRTYLASMGEWHLPVLTGIISAPIVRGDGTVLYQEGYDPQTGLYLTEAWDQPLDCPSREDALQALATLRAPFAEFPFIEPVDESVFLCGILTAIQRRLLPTAPGFGFTAPSPRTGKSKLAECLALIATGRQAAAMAVAREQEETRKAVIAALREGHAIVNLDNVEHVLASPDLSRAITQTEYADRILGETRILRAPTNLLWTATGNNLTFQGDLATRFLLCRLDAGLERPEGRRFKIHNLEEHIYRNRRALVQAALTILTVYHTAGSPSQNLTEYGGFEVWSREVRSPLVWLGLPDPCLSRDSVLANDPGRETALTLLQAWYATFPDTAVPINQLIRVSSTHGPLHEVLTAVAPLEARGGQGVDVKRLSYWCRQWKGRVVGEFRLRSENHHKDGMHWYVEKLGR